VPRERHAGAVTAGNKAGLAQLPHERAELVLAGDLEQLSAFEHARPDCSSPTGIKREKQATNDGGLPLGGISRD
jgi:hypothetical protein